MIRETTVDDFGTQWFVAKAPGFHDKQFPSQVFLEIKGQEPGYHQVASLEAWCSWGLVTRDEVTALGFNLRW